MQWARRAIGHLSYANVVATVALFVALGGASYAAVELPPRSVGPRQLRTGAVRQRALGLPLGVTSASNELVHGEVRTPCNGGRALAPGEAPFSCPAGLQFAKGAGGSAAPTLASARLRLRSAGRLLATAVVAIANGGSSAATVSVGMVADDRFAATQQLVVSPGQTLEDPLQAVAPAGVGGHVIGLDTLVSYSSAGTGEVLIGPSSLAVTALPSQSG